MKFGFLRKAILLQYTFVLFALVSGCSGMHFSSPKVAAAKGNVNPIRDVTVYLVASPSNGFVPVVQNRIITAEAVTVRSKITAEARRTTQGITTIVVGNSCNELTVNYPDTQECSEVETTVRHYGEVEATATTDSEGFSVLKLASTDYRISMQTWQTSEDTKCSWSGSKILPENTRVLELPILVFCE